MYTLGIETSCDETAVAIYHSDKGLIAHQLYSQIALHAQYGGVVPELASRDHIRKVLPLLREALQTAELTLEQINGIAYTAGPGLIGALLVGATIGRSLGFALQIPTIAVHHMEAHLLSPLLDNPTLQFPFIALLVSGGHTLLVKVNKFADYQVLGESVDDAAGEAFDKTAKLLGLPYPGGAQLAELAKQGREDRFHFPRPMTDQANLNFSFSGLKTCAVNTLHQYGDDPQTKADIACAFQMAVVDTLVIKCRKALEQTNLHHLVIAGGVSANQCLREKLNTLTDVEIFCPRLAFCTDNAAMVAYTGCQYLMRGIHQLDLAVEVNPRWEL